MTILWLVRFNNLSDFCGCFIGRPSQNGSSFCCTQTISIVTYAFLKILSLKPKALGCIDALREFRKCSDPESRNHLMETVNFSNPESALPQETPGIPEFRGSGTPEFRFELTESVIPQSLNSMIPESRYGFWKFGDASFQEFGYRGFPQNNLIILETRIPV